MIRLRKLITEGLAQDDFDASKHFLVCVDGSDDSEVGFANAFNVMKGQDRITLLHFSDATKDFLPDKMKPAAIESYYGNILLASLPEDRFNIVVRPRPEPKKPEWFKEAVFQYIGELEKDGRKTDFLVTGFCGRKGPKDDPTVLGSNGDVALRQSGCSAMITKKQWGAPKEKKGRKFAVAIDGSSRSDDALFEARRLSTQGDTISVLHVHDVQLDDQLDEEFKHGTIKAKYESMAGVAAFVAINKGADEEGKKSIPDLLISWINENGPDFFLLGADGSRCQKVRSSLRYRGNYHVVYCWLSRYAECGRISMRPLMRP